MKNFTIVSLLFAGLIATCIGRNLEVDNRDPGSSSSEEFSDSKELSKQIETACYEKTGSSQTFESMGVSFALFPICFVHQLNEGEFINDVHRLNANASARHEFFPKYCPKIRNALTCLDPLINELSKCLDDDQALILHGTFNAIPEALDLICENDGEILVQEGTSLDICIMNFANILEECAADLDITAISKYGEGQCRELVQVPNCIQKKINACPRLMDIFDVFWRAMLKNSPCRNTSSICC